MRNPCNYLGNQLSIVKSCLLSSLFSFFYHTCKHGKLEEAWLWENFPWGVHALPSYKFRKVQCKNNCLIEFFTTSSLRLLKRPIGRPRKIPIIGSSLYPFVPFDPLCFLPLHQMQHLGQHLTQVMWSGFFF